jgi:spermidine synthase
MYSLKFVPQPSSVLVVGLGAGIVPRNFSNYRSNASIDVIEIDSEILNIARAYFGFCGDNITVHIGDAFVALDFLSDQYDIIILDAMMTNYIPFPLMTKEFFEKVKKRVKKNGVLAVNTCNVHHTFAGEVNTLRNVFNSTIYEIVGPRNKLVSMLYICDKKPSKKFDLPSKYYPDFSPAKMKITNEIKNAKIFSLGNI